MITSRAIRFPTVVMGPCLRGDDERLFAAATQFFSRAVLPVCETRTCRRVLGLPAVPDRSAHRRGQEAEAPP
jgi:hypothetical protein